MLRPSHSAFLPACLFAILAVGCATRNPSPPPATQSAIPPVPKHTGGGWFAGIDDFVGLLTGDTALTAVQKMEDASSADNRRRGIYDLVEHEYAQYEPYTRRYRQIAQADTDFTVRAAAIRALNWSRDPQAGPVFIKGLADASELVRWEAAKGLANVPDPSAVDALTRVLGSEQESRSVRVAAADALRHYRTMVAARALTGTLAGKDFGVAWQARRSLRRMTGQDLRYNEQAWLEFLTGPTKPVG